ncbi:MAG TPA: cellulase family glycosylhydrolase, partial [Polyangiaceae bacterium]|nr:cellulase family glycosylhydrolase [Polyangiaceae bacterium]
FAAVAANAGALYCQVGDGECANQASGPAHAAATPILHLHGTNDGKVPPPTAAFHAPVEWDPDFRVFLPMKLWAQQQGCFGGDNATGKDNGVLIESFTVGGQPAALYDLSAWGEKCHKYQLLLVTDGGHVIGQQYARIWQFLSGYDLAGPRAVPAAPVPLEPAEPAPLEPAPNVPESPPVAEPALGNGRLLWDRCIPVCASAETDPDETGATDGWGYENGVSCVVAEGDVAQQGPPCDLPLPVEPDMEAAPQPRPEGNSSQGFFVSQGRLYDRLGHEFVMRGVNHPLTWYPDRSLEWLDEIASTGANTVRLVWTTDSPTPVLRDAIAHALEQRMIPMVELHDVTGGMGVDQPTQMAEYYVDELLDVLLEFEDELLINVANEWSGPDELYSEAYARAITLLRDAGIHHTLVIDANDWGQGMATLLSQGPGLLETDPQHNLLFSVHMYHDHFATPESVLGALQSAVQAQLPLIVGEFGSTPILPNGESGSIPSQVLLEEAARLDLGVLAWVWSGFVEDVGSMDLSVDGSADQLTPWGSEVVDGPFGIRNTSQRASVFAVGADPQ